MDKMDHMDRIRAIEKMVTRMVTPYIIGLWEMEHGKEMTRRDEAAIEEAVKVISDSLKRGIEEAVVIFQNEAPMICDAVAEIENIMSEAANRIK